MAFGFLLWLVTKKIIPPFSFREQSSEQQQSGSVCYHADNSFLGFHGPSIINVVGRHLLRRGVGCDHVAAATPLEAQPVQAWLFF